jgi:hypothetical protein
VTRKKRVLECFTDQERFKVRSPPLGETVADFPVVVNAMRGVKLTRIGRRCEAFVKKAFESFDLVLSRFQVVTWAATCKSAKHQRAFCGEN